MRRSPAVGVVLLAVLMGAVVVLVGGWQVYKRVSAPSALPPPDGPWPRTGGITVFLCAEDSVFPVCAKKAYTKAQRQAVEAALRARPAVSDVEFRSQKEDSVRARLKPGDWTPLVAELKKLPGVSNVIAMKTPFWVGKADVGVGLCHVRTPAEKALEKSVGFKPRSCVGHDGYPSDDERQAILERILTVPGVEKVYYEDLDHARRVYEYTTGEQPLSFVSGAFLIRFAGRPDDQAVDRGVEAVKKAVEGLPGVEGVAAIRDQRRLLGATEERKRAIELAIRGLPGVRGTTFGPPPAGLPEAFYLVVRGDAKVADVERALRGMSAVAGVSEG